LLESELRANLDVDGNQSGTLYLSNCFLMTDNEQTITYEDFVVGLANKTMKFEIKNKKLFSILFFDSFIAWTMRVLLFLVVLPIFLIPFLCFKLNNWWLLFGFIGMFLGFSVHGINTKSSRPIKNMVELTLCLLLPFVILAYYVGIFQPAVFSFACLIYTFFFLDLSNNLWDDLAQKSLSKKSDLFYLAVDKNIIDVSYR
jgi:hypothetical protein